MSDHQRQPFKGKDKALVIGIDVGTTFSGVSYAILQPGKVPEVRSLIQYKGQESVNNSAKVPTVIYYNSAGEVVARGSEPNDGEGDEDHFKVEWFKLLLRPASSKLTTSDLPPCELPDGVTITDVWAEFLRYLNECARDYIEEREVGGSAVWETAGQTVNYVLTLPNGWGGHQQDQMRTSAIKGGLIPDTPEGKARVTFLSEGEASFHWCIDEGIAGSSLEVGSQIIICDAGGGTIDVSSFRINSLKPLTVVEASESDCRVVGSVFVTNNFRHAVTDKLEDSKWASDEYIAKMTEAFDTKSKCIFQDKNKATRIKFGMRADTDENYDIKHGFITLPGSSIASFFENSCRESVEAIDKQLPSDSKAYVFLVGGFSASPYLFNEIKKRLADKTTNVYRGESAAAKAVSHGAVAYYLDRVLDSNLVQSRVAKETYGVPLNWRYDPNDESHKARDYDVYTDRVDGYKYVRGGFDCLLQKGDSISVGSTYRSALRRTYSAQDDISWTVTLERYSGIKKNVKFKDTDSPSTFKDVCQFKVEMPKSALVKKQGANGEYWEVRFTFVLTLGETHMRSSVEWRENGETKSTPATSTWEDF